MSQRTPLDDVVVVDLSCSVAGQFCGRLFADNGATVLLVEPAHGSPTRAQGPFAKPRSAGSAEESCLFWHLNLGKQAFTAPDLSADGSPEVVGDSNCGWLADLIAKADVLVMDEATQSFEIPVGQKGPAVVCDITSFGREGPWKGWQGGELVHQALSGTMFENGHPDREPLYGVGHRSSYAAGLIGYLQSVAALRVPAAGRHVVDVSVVEVAASMNFNRATQYSYNRVIEDRDPRTIPRALVRCADGWVSLFIYDHRWHQSCLGLGLSDLAEDPRFQTEEARLFNWHAFVDEVERRFGQRRVEDVIAAGQQVRAVVAKARSPVELLGDPGLVARGFWAWREAGRLPKLGPMFRFSATPQHEPADAPVPAYTQPALPASPGVPPNHGPVLLPLERPLVGTRVVDLTTAWSGPMATRLLASLGADVVKIEGPGRTDDWRGPASGGLASRYPDRDQGERPYDRCYQFNTQNHDKRDVVLDLKNPAGREIALSLLARADIMIANFRPGTLDRMGLGWDHLHEVNPRLIVVEMPAYGLTGPSASHVALGPSMEMMSGMARLVGYGDGRPVTTGPAYLDPMGGINTAAAVITALAARDRNGEGQHVEVAQIEAAMHWIGEELVYAAATGKWHEPHANRKDDMAPHGVFPCLGFDEWVVIAAPSDEAFACLCRAIGVPGMADGAVYGPLASRKAHEDELERRIAAWTASRDKHEVATELQAHGVQAAPVCNARDLAQSKFLLERGLLQTVKQAETGSHLYQGVPLHTTPWDLSIREPAPGFGQHTRAVLREELGLDDADLAELADLGVTATAPNGWAPALPHHDVVAVEGAPAEEPPVEEATLAVPGAGQARVRAAGPLNACAVVFIQGPGTGPGTWDWQLRGLLAQEYRVVVVDLSDHGAPPGGWGGRGEDRALVTAAVDDFAAVCGQLQLHQPVIVGWRTGADIACNYVARVGPSHVAGLALVDWAPTAKAGAKVTAKAGARAGARAGEAPPADVPDSDDFLDGLGCPALLCYGGPSGEAVTDAAIRGTLASWRLARCSRYDREGAPFLSDPRRFALELADFTSRASRSRPGHP